MAFARSARLAALIAVSLAFLVDPAQAQTKKADEGGGPPACSAIKFRPVPPGMSDGEQDAGLYKSRYGRIVVKTNVKNGDAEGYFVELNGKKLAPIATGAPASAEACLKEKKITVALKPDSGACVGSHLQVVIDRSQSQKVMMLVVRKDKGWIMCQVAAV